MKRPLIALAGSALVAACGLARAATWTALVQPGEYGRVAIGGYVEAPRVIAPRPLVGFVDRYGHAVEEYVDPAFGTEQMPVYLWVPEAQRLHWAEYCGEYGACGVPVYFVEDRWYRDNVLRRNWTPEQRAWTNAQWLEQDRLARERVERLRFEQQRSEQQRRWESEQPWRDAQERGLAQQASASQPDRDEHAGESRWTRIRSFLFGRPAPAQATAAASAPAARGTAMGLGGDRRGDDRLRADNRDGFDRGRDAGRGR